MVSPRLTVYVPESAPVIEYVHMAFDELALSRITINKKTVAQDEFHWHAKAEKRLIHMVLRWLVNLY